MYKLTQNQETCHYSQTFQERSINVSQERNVTKTKPKRFGNVLCLLGHLALIDLGDIRSFDQLNFACLMWYHITKYKNHEKYQNRWFSAIV